MKRRELTFQEYHILTWMLVLCPMLALCGLSGMMAWWYVLLVLTACLWALLPRFSRQTVFTPSLTLYVLFLILCGVEGWGLTRSSGRVLPALASLLSGVLPLYLYRREKAFGAWMAFLHVALLALIGVILENSFEAYSLFLLFLLNVTWHLNAASLYKLAGPVSAERLLVPRGHIRHFLPSVLAGIIFAGAIFILFPRSPGIHNPFGMREKGVNSGYTGKISLRSESQIQATQTLAFIAESTDTNWLARVGPNLYLRTTTSRRARISPVERAMAVYMQQGGHYVER